MLDDCTVHLKRTYSNSPHVPVTALNHQRGRTPAGAATPLSASRFGWIHVNAVSGYANVCIALMPLESGDANAIQPQSVDFTSL